MEILEWHWDWVLIGATLMISIVTLLYHLGTRTHSRFSKYHIPQIQPLPFIGSMDLSKMNSFPQQVLDMYDKLKDHQYGGCFVFSSPVFFIVDPELIKSITVKDFEYFTDHRTFVSEQSGNDAVWSKGLFSLKGQRWREMRSKLTPVFTSSKMKTMFVLMSECCKQLVDFLEECQHKSDPGCNISKENAMLVLELKEFFTRYANDVIATTAFGISMNSLKEPRNEFFKMGQEAVNLEFWRFFGFMMFPKIMESLGLAIIKRKVTEFFRSLVLDTMHTREKQGIVRHDMLQLMMEAKKISLSNDNTSDKKIKLEDDDIVAQAVIFFLAGFDTASTMLCFICYMIATHPEIYEKLQGEVDKTMEDNNGKLTYEALNNMKYLDMVVSETLRIYPPSAIVDRVCTKSYVLNADLPVELSPGEYLYIPIFGLHRDPKHFPEPEKFDPERFNEENKHNINPFTYLPFGVGPRSCIGNRFALLEAKLVLVYLLSKFNIKTVDKTPKSIKLIQKGFNLSITGGFWMGLESRGSRMVNIVCR